MLAEYKGSNGQPPQIPPEVMAEMRFRVLIGHAGPNRTQVLCRGYIWNAKNNRWTLDLALANSRINLPNNAKLLVATLYENMVIIGHPMTMVPLKSTAKTGGDHAPARA